MKCEHGVMNWHVSCQQLLPSGNLQVEFRRISLTGFRSCVSRSQTGASQSRQSTEDNAYENTQIYKERTKKWHDSRLQGDKDFKVGDLEVILNGDSPVPTRIVEGILQPVAPTTTEQKLARKNELKARGTLLMALLDKHQLKFYSHKDAKTLVEAIEKRFEGNTETKKVQKTLLKQQHKNFTGSSSESLDQIHDTLQKLVNQLKIHGVSLSQEEVNLNTTELLNAAASFYAVCAKRLVSSLPNVDSLSNAINVDDPEEMDLRWQMAMLTMRARRFLQKTGRNLGANGPTSMDFDMSKAECYNCYRKGHFARECRIYQAAKEPANYALMAFSSSSSSSDNELRDNALVTLRQKLEKAEQESDDLKLRFQPSDGYHAVPPPYTGKFMPPKLDLVFNTTPTAVETDHSAFTVQLSPTKPAQDLSHIKRHTAPIIEDWVSDSEDESETKAPHIILITTPKPVSPKPASSGKRRNRKACFVCKSVDHLIKDCDYHAKKMAQPTPKNHAHMGNHMVPTAVLTQSKPVSITAVRPISADVPKFRKMAQPTPKNHAHRGNHMVPTAVLTQSKQVSITAVRPISADVPKFRVTQPRHAKPFVTKSKSPIKRHLTRSHSPKTSNLPPRVTAVKASVVSAAQGMHGKWEWRPKCPILDHVSQTTGKFDGKVDEGFLVRYSVNSKAFRVFNSRTRIVQETLHVIFLENKPNIAGSSPTWLFDTDSLTRTMNYQPVTAGNQTNLSASFQDKFNAEKVGEEIDQQYMLFPMWSFGFTNPQNNDRYASFDGKEHDFDAKKLESEVSVSPSSSAQSRKQDDKTKKEAKGKSPVQSFTGYKDLSVEFEDCSDNRINEVNVAGTIVPTVGQNSLNSTNTFSVAGPLNAAASPTYGKSSFIDASQLSNDPDMPKLEDITYSDVGAEADFNNLETSITISPIPTTRVHKDHPVSQIIGDLRNPRGYIKLSKIQVRLKLCRKSFFSSRCRKNKARLIAQGHTQEEKIDYEVVFALVARIEAIGLFLAYASFMGFIMYQMDVKSVFLYGTIEEEVYVCQSLGFEDPDHPDKVYKVVKAHYGLHQAPRACQDKYVAEILRKFGLTEGKSASTPIDTDKPLLKDPDGEDVDAHTYSDSPLLGVNTPRSDDDRLELMELMVFLLPKIEKVRIGVNVVDLQVSAVRHMLLLLVQKFLLFSMMNWCCSLSAVRSSKLASMGYEKPSTKVTFYKAFFSSQWKLLIHTILQCMSAKRTSWNEFSSSMASVVICLSSGDLSTHTTKYTSPALTQKVFANMRRVGKGFYGVETPLFKGMLVEQHGDEKGDADEHVEEVNTGDAGGDDSADHREVQPPSPKPQSQPQPQQAADFPMSLLQEALDACGALTRRVEHLKYDKVAQALEITKLKRRVKKLEKRNKVRVLKLRRLQRVGTSQRVETSDDTVMDDGRQAESQAKIYKIDMDHANKVLSMQEDETEPTEVQEIVDVVTTTKLITKVVTAASETVTAASAIITTVEAQVPVATTATLTTAPARVAAAPSRRRKGVIIRDPEEVSATSTIIPAETKSKDKGKGIFVEEPKPLKKKQQIEQDKQFARKLHDKLNKDIDWDAAIDNVKLKAKEDPAMEEEENRALQTINETPAEKAAKRRKFNEDVEDLKRHLQIVPSEDDDVYTEATPLAIKVPVMDYEIIEMNNKPYYKIIRADRTHQLYISFMTLLRNFDREDLEALWSLVKEKFSTTKPKNFSDDFLLTTLGAMFEKPDAHS
nr:hypothetical protein [Tanacetum cinerariifolium]